VAAAFDFSVPVLIVGGGACGAVAALAARDCGADVLLVEQNSVPMGTTAMSQGLIAAAGTRAQARLSIDDDADIFYADIMTKTRGLADPAIARAIAENAAPTVDWLIDVHRLPLTLDTGFRAAYGNSRLRVHGWAGHGGHDLIQLLHQKIVEADVTVVTAARLIDIHADAEGRVLGISVERPDGAREQIGCETLILASGGFAANHEMVAQFMPEAARARHHGHEGNRGDGILLGQRVGGAVGDMGSYQGYGMLADPQGITVPPGIILEGGILVNVEGRRFTDETADIGGMVHPVMAQPGEHCWLIYDARIEARCSHIPQTSALIALNAARAADTLAELADRIGTDAAILKATLTAAAAARIDDCGRDWGNDVPPAAPFRALRVVGALYHTQGGLQIDGNARVLRADGSRLPNLFAGGGAARGVSGPSSWGYLPAMGLCAAVTLGRLAGCNAARQAMGLLEPGA